MTMDLWRNHSIVAPVWFASMHPLEEKGPKRFEWCMEPYQESLLFPLLLAEEDTSRHNRKCPNFSYSHQHGIFNKKNRQKQPTLIALAVCYKYHTFFPLLNLNCTKPSHSLFCKRKTKIVPNITPTTLRSKLLTCLTFRKKMRQRCKLFDAKCMKKRRRRRGILRAKN